MSSHATYHSPRRTVAFTLFSSSGLSNPSRQSFSTILLDNPILSPKDHYNVLPIFCLKVVSLCILLNPRHGGMVAILLNPVTHIVAFILESASAEDFLPHLRRPLPERSSHILSDCSFAMHFLESRQSSHEPSLNPSLCSLNRLSLSILHGDPSLGIVISLEFSVSSFSRKFMNHHFCRLQLPSSNHQIVLPTFCLIVVSVSILLTSRLLL